MFDDAQNADYYQRRAENQAALAAAARDPKIRQLHDEIVDLYARRAESHAARLQAGSAAG